MKNNSGKKQNYLVIYFLVKTVRYWCKNRQWNKVDSPEIHTCIWSPDLTKCQGDSVE